MCYYIENTEVTGSSNRYPHVVQADFAQHGLPELPSCTCIITNSPPTPDDVSKLYISVAICLNNTDVREGKPKPSQVIIKQNSQMKLRYIYLCLLSREISSRRKLRAGIYVFLKDSRAERREGLACVGDLKIGLPGGSGASLIL